MPRDAALLHRAVLPGVTNIDDAVEDFRVLAEQLLFLHEVDLELGVKLVGPDLLVLVVVIEHLLELARSLTLRERCGSD